MPDLTTAPAYTHRLVDALGWAAERHAHQRRKNDGLPYLTHLMGVATLVWTWGGDEDQAIAGLLHDTVEDTGGAPVLAEIRDRWGERVAAIVDACTDSDAADAAAKAPWRERKEAHLAHLAQIDADTALVVAADKLHNLTSLVEAVARDGAEATFRAFKGGMDGTRWYYRSMREQLTGKIPAGMLAAIDVQLAAIGA